MPSIRFLSLTAAAAAMALGGLAPGALAPLAAQSGAQKSDLDLVTQHLRATKSLRANFSQTDRAGQTVTGTLTLKQPGKIRFEYQKDVNLLIVSDGRALTMIDYDVRQVQRWPIKNSPLSALLDPDRDLGKYGRVLKTADPDVISVEVKDPKRPEYGVITMIFVRKASAPAGLELIGWVALDSQNKRTSIRLSNQRYNVAVADSSFTWRDPRGNRGPRR